MSAVDRAASPRPASDDPSVLAVLAVWDPKGDFQDDPDAAPVMLRYARDAVAAVRATAAAERERDQALAALARIENGDYPTVAEAAAVGADGGPDSPTTAQIIAAAARLNNGGNRA